MRNSRPLRWIEQAEARQVLAAADFQSRQPTRRPARLTAWLRQWLSTLHPAWRPFALAQPVRVAAPACRRDRACRDEEVCPSWR